MTTFKPDSRREFFAAGVAGLGMAMLAGTIVLSGPALAQQPVKPAPAKKADAPKKQEGSAWVKLCQKQKGEDAKGDICLTHHERFHPNTGQPLISTAIRRIEGKEGESIMVMVPLGRLLGPGLLLEIDDKNLARLPYAYCTTLGCVAEAKATDEILGKLKKGSELIIKTIDITQKKVGFKVPLSGFTTAYSGPPIDREVYAQARKEMFEQIRARQIELAKRAKEAAEKKKADGGGAEKAAPKKKAP